MEASLPWRDWSRKQNDTAKIGQLFLVSAMHSITRTSVSPLASRTPSKKNLQMRTLQTLLHSAVLVAFVSGGWSRSSSDGGGGQVKLWCLSPKSLLQTTLTMSMGGARFAGRIASAAPAAMCPKSACAATWTCSIKFELSLPMSKSMNQKHSAEKKALQSTILKGHHTAAASKPCRVCCDFLPTELARANRLLPSSWAPLPLLCVPHTLLISMQQSIWPNRSNGSQQRSSAGEARNSTGVS